ncbi:hypothetical protein CVT26_001765 [Gymnopilus dilepis]|uniref:Uncharacterized protein n=1 Tax=Gymnopilus dilepis TaxID=231916 RepID=A0A409WE69_9AGAR|nr:hypothetical protein CVT26_001765 [Gymnopilus dilepis]
MRQKRETIGEETGRRRLQNNQLKRHYKRPQACRERASKQQREELKLRVQAPNERVKGNELTMSITHPSSLLHDLPQDMR